MRRRGLRSAKLQITIRKSQIGERGYMLITLMLVLALMTIALLAAIPNIKQQIMRDREEEMRHRGTAYMRAIQHYYKKFNAYPNKVEDLENTNNMRFLRKRYTDPMTRDPITGKEKDFKFLHQQDVSLNNGPVLGGQTPGQNGPGGFGAQSGFGGGPQSGFGGSQSAFGGNQSGFGGPGATGPGAQNSATGDPGNSSGSSSSGGSTFGSSSSPGGNSNSFGSSSSNSNSTSGFNGPVFGGGPILGVASTNKKDKSIREFYGKNHYNDWLFIYMPMADRGGLLVGPVNPSMPTGNMGGLTPGQVAAGATGQGGVGQGGFGQSGFGQGGLGQSGGFGQGQGLNGGQNQAVQSQTPQQTPQQ